MAAEVSGIRLVAGLGNPGAEYEQTRHNIGFMVADALGREWSCAWERSPKWGAFWCKNERSLLVKPMSFMNRSGESISAVMNFFKIAPEEVLIVLDDMALPLGRLRLRHEGGSGGHNGLDSVLMHLGTETIPRMRIGIGAAPAQASVDYVLGRFFDEEKPIVQETVTRAAEAVNWAIDKGMLSAMNTFNKAPEL